MMWRCRIPESGASVAIYRSARPRSMCSIGRVVPGQNSHTRLQAFVISRYILRNFNSGHSNRFYGQGNVFTVIVSASGFKNNRRDFVNGACLVSRKDLSS